MTKQIIGRGRESEGLYILDHAIPRHVFCSGHALLIRSPLFSIVKKVVSTVFKFVVIRL